jgi:hypothetical protein
MSSLVILFVTIRNECLPTETALEGFLTGVSFDVVLETCAMLENLQAVFVRALVFEDIDSQGHAGCLALIIFGLVFVEHLHLSFPIMDGF